ncbi:MAG: hypothetical protein GX104_02160 [Spirochaetales bacterium]|nr:hypothetical protein [Spirochaetales bacterium]
MSERSELIACIRSEIVGPSRPPEKPLSARFHERDFADPVSLRRGFLGWQPTTESTIEEILYYDRETPHRKYGAGLLHPEGITLVSPVSPDISASNATDTLGIDPDESETLSNNSEENIADTNVSDSADSDAEDDFEVTSADVRHPSTIGITFCVKLSANGRIIVQLPQNRRFAWQDEGNQPFPLNGRYEFARRQWTDEQGQTKGSPMWRRRPALLPNTAIIINRDELLTGKPIFRYVPMPEASPIELRLDIFPRQIKNQHDVWLVTAVLRNKSAINGPIDHLEQVLYQTYFEVLVENGLLEKYPESPRPFSQLDSDEQSLTLLYRESATWAIGHGCAAGWDAEPDQAPDKIFTDVMPAVQIPSITPDIKKKGCDEQIRLSMRLLATLPDDMEGPAWQSLTNLADEYARWIQQNRDEANLLTPELRTVAIRHLDVCNACLCRINAGITALRNDQHVRTAFKLANLSMLLQQITTKQLSKRPLRWDQSSNLVVPDGDYKTPWDVYQQGNENSDLGLWRAFQMAFLLMSIEGVSNGHAPDRDIVDLIWFPTGGGKTEAYLAVMAFYMFHQRLLMRDSDNTPKRDGTNVLMRYTLRMLTTQQFQRAASLICAMEFLRRNQPQHGMGEILGKRFSLGLWIGSAASPNDVEQAKKDVGKFRQGHIQGNPLILTECPWCRAEIGRYKANTPPRGVRQNQWNNLRTRGISDVNAEGPLLHCTDGRCAFGLENWEHWIPVEVIDERIYKHPPSLVIATADKFAMIAYRPDAGAIFGRNTLNNEKCQTHVPPGLIIQDELHLISGPLGTMYALYEGIFERLCSYRINARWIKPKLIASTATIRGAADQVKSLYARDQMQLFPSPGLKMGDSFFGKYARDERGKLLPGRLYLGIHANDYGSVLTTQVRAFSSALFRPYAFDASSKDPWWTLLTFYNSIRELAGAKTLFDSDIRSRLKFLFNRENYSADNRRNLRIVEELTSRLSQTEIVDMMDRLSIRYDANPGKVIDACLASSIIEVGVDIDRLSLMGVVGQPKTTAQYIQVTGRVGRRWWERPGLIIMIYNPSKSRDRSHYEQFHSYHRRLYERVEPTSVTPFALSAIQRALPGALIAWARQHGTANVQNLSVYENEIDAAHELLQERCQIVQNTADMARSLQELTRVRDELKAKWGLNPQMWEHFPPDVNGEYLMLWPGQYATLIQKQRGIVVASSMRQVDSNAELTITQGYALANTQSQTQQGGEE